MTELNLVNELKGAVEILPSSQDKDAALVFLSRPDVRLLTRRWNATEPAVHWLRIYGIKFSNPKAATFYGSKGLLERLAEMPSDTPVRMIGLESTGGGGLGLFFRGPEGRLIGFAVAVAAKSN